MYNINIIIVYQYKGVKSYPIITGSKNEGLSIILSVLDLLPDKVKSKHKKTILKYYS